MFGIDWDRDGKVDSKDDFETLMIWSILEDEEQEKINSGKRRGGGCLTSMLLMIGIPAFFAAALARII